MSQPDANQIFASLQQFLNERFDLEPTGLTREATLRSVGLDSMMVLDVMLEVEDRLGVKLDDLDDDAREALAIHSAKLLKQSIGSLQQSLRTRSELKNELRLALTTVQSAGNNPLKHTADSSEALSALLRGGYHLYQGIGAGIGNVVMGLVFGRWYQLTNRVWPLVIAHSVMDIVAFVGYALLREHLGWIT